MAEGGIVGRLQEAVESRTGLTLASRDRLEVLEAVATDYRAMRKELDLLGYTVLDYMGGQPQDMDAKSRRKAAQQARNVWMVDPQAGAAVDLMNDFTFGRGVPKPRAKDDSVQKVIDEAWDDPDNQRILTGYAAQIALGVDLSLQSNIFLLMFTGDDGKVKLGLLNHDEVENVVRDPDNRLRVLWYVAKHRSIEWDFETDQPKMDPSKSMEEQAKSWYYEHWNNYEAAVGEGGNPPKPPKAKINEGRVYHIAINRTHEMAFGVPTFRRLFRWYSAYNDFMAARVDIAQAAAAFIMKRKVKGTPNQVAKMAAKAISRQSELSGATGTGTDPLIQQAPRGGSVMTENENVSHEPFKFDSGSPNAATDAQMIRAQLSAATRFPQSYYGDATNSNLATATSLELPVLKAVESRQEVFEQVFRWFIDRVIEEAVTAGKISAELTPEEVANGTEEQSDAVAQDAVAASQIGGASPYAQEAYEDQSFDEQTTQRDLSYEFSMPSPLRRMMTDLVTACTSIATTFDPNGTNTELSRILMTIALGEALEMQDPADAVDKIFPPGYVDPALAAAQAQASPYAPAPAAPSGDGSTPTDSANNPYSGPGMSQDYQNNGGSLQAARLVAVIDPTPMQMEEAVSVTRARDGSLIWWLQEQRYADLPNTAVVRTEANKNGVEKLFEQDVESVAMDALTKSLVGAGSTNGNGNGAQT